MKNQYKKRIFFVLPSLSSGGAERVMSFVCQNISKEKFDPLLIITGFDRDSSYNIKGIKIVYLNKTRVLFSVFSLFVFFSKNKPDIVLSSMSHVNTVMGFLSIFFPKTKFIGREANVLSIKKHFGTKQRFYNKFPLTKISYKFLDIVLCQSKDMFHDLMLNYDIPKKKLIIINNPITDDFKLQRQYQSFKKSDVAKFITVASLKKQKGHERIIRAISKLDFPYTYTIVGSGPEKSNLFELIDKLGIRDKINHVPYTSEVSEYLTKSDLFLQGAFVEGFPNCLIESCSVGTPIVAFRAPGGLNEIIEEGVNGFIADTEKEYIEHIVKSIKNHHWDPKTIHESVVKKFNKEKILSQYENLFMNILK